MILTSEDKTVAFVTLETIQTDIETIMKALVRDDYNTCIAWADIVPTKLAGVVEMIRKGL